MQVSSQTIRIAALVVVFVLLYGSRVTKGVAKETAAGLEFALKPMVVVARIGALLLYAGFLGYTVHTARTPVPAWFYLVFVVAIGFILLQLPGTIVLGAQEMSQTFWLMKKKVIGYGEVMAMQVVSAGRSTRVMGDNRVVITHTQNHAAGEVFRAEMERRSGKKLG